MGNREGQDRYVRKHASFKKEEMSLAKVEEIEGGREGCL